MAQWNDVMERVKEPGSVVLKNWLMQRKESAVGKLIAYHSLNRPVFSGRNYATFSKEAYQINIIAFRCIELISTSAARVPWVLYRDDKEIDKHPMLELLKRPNPQQSGKEFFTAAYAFDLLAGNSYLERSTVDSGRRVKEMYALRPDRMKVVPGRFGAPAAFEYTVNSLSKRFDVDPITGIGDVLHVKRFNPLDDWYGQSPLEAMAMSVDSHNEATKWNFAILRNGARPSGALEYPQELPDAEFERLKSEITENYGSGYTDIRPGALGKQGRPMLLQGGLKWVQMMLSQMDIDWAKGKEINAREVALGYSVPEQLVGVPGQQTYNNYREARMALYEDAVLPLLDRFAEAITNWMQSVPEFEGLRIGYDEDRIPAMAPRREALWDRVQNAKHLTIDEKREALGYGVYEPEANAGPGGFIYVSAAELPLTDAFNDLATGSLETSLETEEEEPIDGDKPQDQDTAPVPAGGKPGAPTPDKPVANLALNGAQIQAVVQVVQNVVDGLIPADTAVQLLLIAFPSLDESAVRALIAPTEGFESDKPDPPAMIPGQPPQPPQDGKPGKPAIPPKKPETPVEKHVVWYFLELQKKAHREELRMAHKLAYGRNGRRKVHA